jgi:hypothetical protein
MATVDLVGLDELIDPTAARPVHRPELVVELHGYLEQSLGQLAGMQHLQTPVVVSKARIAELSSYESVVPISRRTPFSRSEKGAFGEVVDVAITIALGTGAPAGDAVARALEEVRARRRGSLAEVVDGLAPAARNAFVCEAEDLVAGLLAVWPDIPRTQIKSQVRLKVRLLGGAVVLSGQPDLILGSLQGEAGMSRAVVLDWKTGGIRSSHIGESHFYGLVAALASKVVPPWRVATFYLGSRGGIYDDVSEEHLREAADQVVAAVMASPELCREQRNASRRVGPERASRSRPVEVPTPGRDRDELGARRSSRARAQGDRPVVADTPAASLGGRAVLQRATDTSAAIYASSAGGNVGASSTAGDPVLQLVSRNETVAGPEIVARPTGPGVLELVVGRLDDVIGVYFLAAFVPPIGDVVVDVDDSDILRARCRQLLGELVVAAVEFRDTMIGLPPVSSALFARRARWVTP